MDGRYTQILKDGFPAFGGFSDSLSLLDIPPHQNPTFSEIYTHTEGRVFNGGIKIRLQEVRCREQLFSL